MNRKDADNPAFREHIINTHWQKLVDMSLATDPAEYVKEIDLALEILQAVKLPLAWETLRVSSMKITDAIVRMGEEREAENGS